MKDVRIPPKKEASDFSLTSKTLRPAEGGNRTPTPSREPDFESGKAQRNGERLTSFDLVKRALTNTPVVCGRNQKAYAKAGFRQGHTRVFYSPRLVVAAMTTATKPRRAVCDRCLVAARELFAVVAGVRRLCKVCRNHEAKGGAR